MHKSIQTRINITVSASALMAVAYFINSSNHQGDLLEELSLKFIELENICMQLTPLLGH